MNRLIAILSKKFDQKRLENKVKRINGAIEAALTNAETDLLDIEDKMANTLAKLEDDVEAKVIINELKDLIDHESDVRSGIEALKRIKTYINEPVEVDETPKKK